MVPRAVLVERPSEYDELLARHATHEQVRFFLSQRGRALDEVLERHAALAATHRAVLGAVQAFGLRPSGVAALAWTVATGLGLTAGLAIGSAAVGYDTGTVDLVIQGAVSGAFVGAAQAIVLRPLVGRLALLWAPALGALWALGWAITASIGVDVERQYTVFGSSGAIVVTALTVVLPLTLDRNAAQA